MSSTWLPEQLRREVEAARVAAFCPRGVAYETLTTGAQKTTRAGRRTLSAFTVRTANGDLELVSIVRDRLLVSRAGEQSRHDDEIVWAYLEQEARSELAMRSLALGEGAAERLVQPLDETISANARSLPATVETSLDIDGRPHRALCVSLPAFAVAWTDLADRNTALLVHCVGSSSWPALVSPP